MPHMNAQSLTLNGELLAELEEPEILPQNWQSCIPYFVCKL
jgi:hypothetical protein